MSLFTESLTAKQVAELLVVWGRDNGVPNTALGVAPRTTGKEDSIESWVVFLQVVNSLGEYLVGTFDSETGQVDLKTAYFGDDFRKAWAEFCQRAYPFQKWPRQ